MENEQDTNISEEQLDEQEEESLDDSEQRFEDNLDIQEDYPAPEPEEKINQWSILDKAIKNKDTIKTTYLSEQELGRPLFSVRFYGTYRDLSRHYLDVELDQLDFDAEKSNIIKDFFTHKIRNITDSGMSNKGFAMNLSVTHKRDNTRRRVREVTKDGSKAKS